MRAVNGAIQLRAAFNDEACAAADEVPALFRGGILLLGGSSSSVTWNATRGNTDTEANADGIVLMSAASFAHGANPTRNTVEDDTSFRNSPHDISYDGTGTGQHWVRRGPFLRLMADGRSLRLTTDPRSQRGPPRGGPITENTVHSADVSPERWATFDCYGTLVDWMSGIRSTLARLFPDADPESLLARYNEVEPRVQTGRAISYRAVMAKALAGVAEIEGLAVPQGETEALAESLPTWPVFPDVAAAMSQPRARGWKLAILSNTDADLLAIRSSRSAST